MSTGSLTRSIALSLTLLCWSLGFVSAAGAQGLEDDGGASWHLEQPAPPEAPPNTLEAPAPISLGRIGDIEFAPGMTNRAVLITGGNPPTIEPGVWEFNGVSWHELSNKCGASDGRIVWTGPEQFWTISNGRPGGQTNAFGVAPPIRDDTLCRFGNSHPGEPLKILESFAFPAFEADSYQAMNAAACLGPSDCWFAGEPLPTESSYAGSFHLHWNGSELLEQPYLEEGYPVESMQSFEGRIFESVMFGERDRVETALPPAPVHVIEPEGASSVFQPLRYYTLPLYEEGGLEFPQALSFLHLAAGEELLWAAAGPQTQTPRGSNEAQLTIARYAGGVWQQELGPETTTASEQPFPRLTVSALAVEPGSEDAWVGLDTPGDYAAATGPLAAESGSESQYAQVARITPDGSLSKEDEQELPSAEEPTVGPRGAAVAITCPARHDCWLATSRGWLFHLSTETERAEQAAGVHRDTDPAFEVLITERPLDKGIPTEVPATVPIDDSGLLGEATKPVSVPKEQTSKALADRVTVPLLSHVRSRLVHGSTLELSFHLAVKARLKLVAKRHRSVIASTPERTFKAGNRTLALRLDPNRWPTKLMLKSQALAPLPTETLNESNETTVTTSELANPLAKVLTGSLPTGLLP